MDRRLLPPTQRPRSNRTHQLHRSRGEDAPPGPQGLLRPGARGGPRSAEPPAWAGVRASARLGPPGPSRAGSAPTHIPGRRAPGLSPRGRSSSPPRRAPRVGAQGPSGRGGSTSGRGGSTNSRAPGAGPACQRSGKPLAAAAAAPFGSSSSLLPPAHTTPTSGSREARRHRRRLHPLPGHRLLSASGDTGSDALFASESTSTQAASSLLTEADPGRGAGGGGTRPRAPGLRVRACDEPPYRPSPGARAHRGAGRDWPRPATHDPSFSGSRRERAEIPWASPGSERAGKLSRSWLPGPQSQQEPAAGAGPGPP